jgi:hypothetical protein
VNLSRRRSHKYCDERRKDAQEFLPAVYRFVCRDGRFYVGSTRRTKIRAQSGVQRWGCGLSAAIMEYPSETWRFEIGERLAEVNPSTNVQILQLIAELRPKPPPAPARGSQCHAFKDT